MSRSSVIYYYDVDGLGSVALANDASGTVQDKYVYDGWGVVRSSKQPILNSFGYTSREFSEIGLMYYRARYYNPNVGRFVSEDAKRFESGVNHYVYPQNNPVLFTDPTGQLGVLKKFCIACISGLAIGVGGGCAGGCYGALDYWGCVSDCTKASMGDKPL